MESVKIVCWIEVRRKWEDIEDTHNTHSYIPTSSIWIDCSIVVRRSIVVAMADEEVLFDDVYELCEIIGKWVSGPNYIELTNCAVLIVWCSLIGNLSPCGFRTY